MINIQATRIRPRMTLEAMYQDGSKETAEAVAEWIEDRRTDEHDEQAAIAQVGATSGHGFAVIVKSWDVADFTVWPHQWVVLGTSNFIVFTEEHFQETYEVVG